MLPVLQPAFNFSYEILSGAGYALTLSIFLFFVVLPISAHKARVMNTQDPGNFVLYFGASFALAIFIFGFAGTLVSLSAKVLPFAIAFSHITLFFAYVFWAAYMLGCLITDAITSRV